MVTFNLSCTSDKIWNLTELISYLVAHQNKDVSIEITPEAIGLENIGLYKILDQFNFNSVNIKTWNPLEAHPRYNIELVGNNYCIAQTPNCQAAGSLNTHAFLCLYHRPTAARLGIAGYLHKYHKENSIIHFSAKTEVDDRVHFELDKLLSWDLESVVNATELIPSLPILQSSPDRYTMYHGYDYNDPLTQLYNNIFVDVVVESHVGGTTFFPSEKTFRPIILGKPFVVFGSLNFLAYLRQMGFKTFWEYWDEEYDGYANESRLIKIYQTLKQIGSLTQKERLEITQAIQPIIEHNRNLILEKRWTNQIKLIND